MIQSVSIQELELFERDVKTTRKVNRVRKVNKRMTEPKPKPEQESAELEK